MNGTTCSRQSAADDGHGAEILLLQATCSRRQCTRHRAAAKHTRTSSVSGVAADGGGTHDPKAVHHGDRTSSSLLADAGACAGDCTCAIPLCQLLHARVCVRACARACVTSQHLQQTSAGDNNRQKTCKKKTCNRPHAAENSAADNVQQTNCSGKH